jgi:hypothetical protein
MASSSTKAPSRISLFPSTSARFFAARFGETRVFVVASPWILPGFEAASIASCA